jgi:hypothetical protein
LTAIELPELIDYENENTGLDFKAVQYLKPQNGELLMDVIAMANADWEGDRYIVVGVKDTPSEKREFPGIKGTFTDQANLQQLVHENVEPHLNVSYEPLRHRDVLLGILRIQPDKLARPYLMKKDYPKGGATLHRGDGFIRRGTSKHRLERSDFERFYSVRQKQIGYSGELFVSFADSDGQQRTTLLSVGHSPVPSQCAAIKIQDILNARQAERECQREQQRRYEENMRRLEATSPYISNLFKAFGDITISNPLAGAGLASMGSLSSMFGSSVPYEHRSDEELQKNLLQIGDTYRADDLYVLHEIRAAKVNFVIENRGEEYVEDASLRLTIDSCNGQLVVVKRPVKKPYRSLYSFDLAPPTPLDYPVVKFASGQYVVTQWLGDIKHLLPKIAFGTDLRIAFENSLSRSQIFLNIELLGRNLPHPVAFRLQAEVVCEDG